MEPLIPDPYWTRRRFIQWMGMAGVTATLPLSCFADQRSPSDLKKVKSLIILWLEGGLSQLESFDPHPNQKIANGSKAIKTSLPGIKIDQSLPSIAEIMNEITVIRSMTSQEGDHERGVYNMQTGYRPDPVLQHPSLGAILCKEDPPYALDIPHHISFYPGNRPSKGGYLGPSFDSFKTYDPLNKVPNIKTRVSESRHQQRLKHLYLIEEQFTKGRRKNLDHQILHRHHVEQALKMMNSKHLEAFNISDIPKSKHKAYGDSEFGRGCLAALQLVEAGVKCVEVSLRGWDTHINNHENQANLLKVLDPAFASLHRDLKERNLWDSTVVLCTGEFGRTPILNKLEGRDHWPQGFSLALFGGGIRRGYVLGETDPKGEKRKPADAIRIQDLHATLLHHFGINHEKELMTPIRRPLALSSGGIVDEILEP